MFLQGEGQMGKLLSMLVLGITFGCAGQPQPSPAAFLTEAQLKALFSKDTTLRFDAGGAIKGVGTYFLNGTARVNWGSGGALGKWRIVGDRFCTTYPNLRRGRETCNSVQKTGERTYTLFFPDGSLNATWEIQP